MNPNDFHSNSVNKRQNFCAPVSLNRYSLCSSANIWKLQIPDKMPPNAQSHLGLCHPVSSLGLQMECM